MSSALVAMTGGDAPSSPALCSGQRQMHTARPRGQHSPSRQEPRNGLSKRFRPMLAVADFEGDILPTAAQRCRACGRRAELEGGKSHGDADDDQ